MAELTISEGQVPNPCQYPGDTATLRLWYSQDFMDSDGLPVVAGLGRADSFYKIVDCTINGSRILHWPAFTVQTTTDGIPTTARLFARFYDKNGKPRDWFFQGNNSWIMPANLAPTTTYELLQGENVSTNYITNPPAVYPTYSAMVDYVNTRIPGAGAPKMTTVIDGVGRLSKAASDVTDPVVLSDTEPIYTGTTGVRAIAEFVSLSDAITQIGSTVTTLLIPSNVATNSATVPSTLTLQFGEAGKLTVASGQTVTINSKPNLIPGKQVFFGTGSVVFGTNAASDGVDLGWWAASGDDVTDKIAYALTSLDNCSGGILNVPAGTWVLGSTTITVPNSVTIRGQGHEYDTDPSVTTFSLTAHSIAAFTCSGAFRNIAFENLRIEADSHSTTIGIKATGANPNSAFGFRCTNVVFNNLGKGIQVDSTGGSWQLEDIRIDNCQFFNCVVYAFQIDTINSSIVWIGGEVSVPSGAVGLQTDGIGSLNMFGTVFGGAGTGIKVDGTITNMTFYGIENEGNDFLLISTLSDLNPSINFVGGFIQSPIKISASINVNFLGTIFNAANLFVLDAAVQCFYTAIGCPGFDTALDDNSAGVSVRLYSADAIGYNKMDRQLTVVDHALSAATPIIDSYSDTTSKVFLRMGQSVAGVPTNTYTFTRNSNGFLAITGNQLIANRGLSINAPIEIAAEIATTPTAAASKGIIALSTSHLLQWTTNAIATIRNFLGASTSLTANTIPMATDAITLADSTITKSGSAYTITGSLNVTSTENVVGNWSVATNKATVAAATGNAAFAGTLGVTGAATFSSTATVATSLAIGSGTAITKVLKGTVTIDPASINATTVSSQTFTLTGAATSDSLTLNPPAAGLTAGLLVCQYFVSAANTITIVFYNSTGAPIDEASASWTYHISRS